MSIVKADTVTVVHGSRHISSGCASHDDVTALVSLIFCQSNEVLLLSGPSHCESITMRDTYEYMTAVNQLLPVA